MESHPKAFFRLLAVLTLAIFTFLATSVSSSQIIFGPKTYTRASGPPQIITDSFSTTPGSQYKLVLTNNGLSDSATELVADSFIYLNGVSIVGIHNFSQSTETLEVSVELQENNTLEVEVRGTEGGSITVQIITNP